MLVATFGARCHHAERCTDIQSHTCTIVHVFMHMHAFACAHIASYIMYIAMHTCTHKQSYIAIYYIYIYIYINT